jgi:NAD(P)-dependent dehydrogenase (short-subunit alcohol dehydrogenase family)
VTARRLEGRRAIVTGAAGGQGEAVCRRFREEGASVMATDVDPDALAALATRLGVHGGALVTAAADLRDDDAIAEVVERTRAAFGGLEVLYNNASLRAGRDGPVADLDVEVWDLTFAVNARGTFLFCQHALPLLLASGRGVVINVASASALRGDRDCHAYGASKGAVLTLTRSLAQAYGPRGLRAVALCPGFIATPMVSTYLDDAAVRDRIVEATALRRIGEPGDIASVAAFLASGEAAFLTDEIISVHGGLAG